MTGQTTGFLVDEILRIVLDRRMGGRDGMGKKERAEERETLIACAEELAQRVKRGDLKDRPSMLQDWL